MSTQIFEDRKKQHIQHSLDLKNQAIGFSGFDRIQLLHDSIPDCNFDEVEISETLFGKDCATPFFVPGMTAGHPDALEINHRIASQCEKRGWVFGIGSQRRELDFSGEGATIDRWDEFREKFPNLKLLSNLGVTQIIHTPVEKISKLLERVKPTALAIHLNPLQEVIQPEGTPQFRGAFHALKRVTEELDLPIIVKETGCGFSASALMKLSSLNLAAIDVSGLGGTHWGRIEGARLESSHDLKEVSSTFANWGISTVESLKSAKKVFSSQSLNKTEIWASGGVRTGLDAAKCIALGAKRVGFAKPVLEAALQGESELESLMKRMEYELRVALFCTGATNPHELREKGESVCLENY